MWGSAEQENLDCETIAEDVAKHAAGTPQGEGVRLAAETIAARIRQRRLERGPQAGQAF